jgi:hypothetical protein
VRGNEKDELNRNRMKPCTYCGGQNREAARFCGHCGRPFPSEPAPEQSVERQLPSRRVATLLSFLWPGFGQLYKGETIKAIAFYATHIILWRVAGLVLLREAVVRPLVSLAALSGLTVFWIYGMVDARRGTAGKAWRHFSPTMELVTLSILGIIVVSFLGIPVLFPEATVPRQLLESLP